MLEQEKPYGEIYRVVQEMLRLPENYLEEQYSTKLARHFYTKENANNGNQGCGQCLVFKGPVHERIGAWRGSGERSDDIEEMRLEPLTREQLLVALARGEFTVASHVAAVGLGLLLTG